MQDELSINYTISANDGSRFAVVTIPLETPVSSLAGTVAPSAVLSTFARFALSSPDESLVIDDRSNLTPAQMVESKLINRLRESSLPVSHLQMRGLVRNRPDA